MIEGATKKPLCKFMNNCREFKETKKCNFRHDRCRFQDKCQNKLSCKFYHPQIQGQLQAKSKQPRQFVSSKPKQTNARCKFGMSCKGRLNGKCTFNHDVQSSQPCKYGNTCERKFYGKCMYNHDNQPAPGQKFIQGENSIAAISSLPAVMQQCRFGVKCNNFMYGTCKYRHVEAPKNTGDIPMKTQVSFGQPAQQKMQEPQDDTYYNGQFQQFEASKVCQGFLVGQCNLQQCSRAHQLTLDNSLKRLFIKKFNQPQDSNLRIKMFTFKEKRVFILSRINFIAFYQLDEQYQVLKSVCSSDVRAEALITYLTAVPNKKNTQNPITIIFATQNNKLYKFQPTSGSIESIGYQNSEQISGVVSFTKQYYLMIGNRISDLLILNNVEKQMEFHNRNGDRIGKIGFIKDFQLYGQKFVIIGTERGYINFVNKNLETSFIQIPNNCFIDACVAKCFSKPYAFVVTCQNQRDYKVLAVDLLDLTWSVVLSYSLSPISKICVVYGRIFVGIDGSGVIIYSLPDFHKIKGRIPLKGTVTLMEGDSDGNLLLHEAITSPRTSIVSIYKVRK